MSFITDIYKELQVEFEGDSKKNHVSAFYTLINYIELIDDGLGLSEQELQDRFFKREEYSNIVQKLIKHSVLEKSQEGNYTLNSDAKKLITPIFEDLMSLAQKPDEKVESFDPALKLLYKSQNQVFTS